MVDPYITVVVAARNNEDQSNIMATTIAVTLLPIGISNPTPSDYTNYCTTTPPSSICSLRIDTPSTWLTGVS